MKLDNLTRGTSWHLCELFSEGSDVDTVVSMVRHRAQMCMGCPDSGIQRLWSSLESLLLSCHLSDPCRKGKRTVFMSNRESGIYSVNLKIQVDKRQRQSSLIVITQSWPHHRMTHLQLQVYSLCAISWSFTIVRYTYT